MRFMSSFLLLCVLSFLSVFSSFVLSSDTYNADLSRSLLHIAGASYCHPSWLSTWSCSFCKEEPRFKVHKVVDNSVTVMQTIVGVLNNNSIVVAFKGTDPLSLENWLEDLSFDAKSVAICPAAGCQVHQGFYDTYMSVQDETITAVKELKTLYPDFDIMITGHSLGGALTTIAALDFAQIPQLMPSHVYTFGQPRVGNTPFQLFFNQLLYNSSVYRVTHGMDPVPHLPPLSFNFKHFPTEIYYGELNQSYLTCDGSGEDTHCSDKWIVDLLITDHLTYLGLDFLTEFLACKLEMGKK